MLNWYKTNHKKVNHKKLLDKGYITKYHKNFLLKEKAAKVNKESQTRSFVKTTFNLIFLIRLNHITRKKKISIIIFINCKVNFLWVLILQGKKIFRLSKNYPFNL
jgi:hypothetical protein